MKFLTKEEAARRVADALGTDGLPVVPVPGCESRTVPFEDEPGHKHYALAEEIVAGLGPFDWCLLWVVLTGVWPSCENLHLYYRLRQSYGDLNDVHDRPALLALRHEEVDLVSFLNLGMLFGWEMYLVTSHDYGRAFVSHDGAFVVSKTTTVGGTEDLSRAPGRPAT